METYLSIIENSLGYSAIHIVIGIIAVATLACLLAVMASRRKAIKQVAVLEKAQVAHEQAQAQLSENLQATQEQLQRLEHELTTKNHHIEQIEQEKQAAQQQAERVVMLEGQISQRRQKLAEVLDMLAKDFALEAAVYDSADAEQEDLLWQRHSAALGQLTNRLQAEEQRRKALELIQQTSQAQLVEKESALGEMNQSLAIQAARIANLEQDLSDQQALMQAQLDNVQAELAKLEAKNHSYKATIGKLETGRMQVFNDLNMAVQKIHQLETASTNKQNAVGLIKQEPAVIQQPVVQPHVEAEPVTQKPSAPTLQVEKAPAGQSSEDSGEPVAKANLAEQQAETAPAGTAPQPAPLFNKLLGSIGLGKQRLAQGGSEAATEEGGEPETVEPQPEEAPTETAPASTAPQPAPLFNKLLGSIGLGKQRLAQGGSEAATEEGGEPETVEPQPEEAPAETAPAGAAPKPALLFNKLLGSIGLGKQQPPEDVDSKADQDTAVQPDSASQDDITEQAAPVPGQLKDLYQKITALTKK